MGNVLSEEQAEETFLKEGFNLESPDADREINYGASVPRCQPQHTDEEERKQAEDKKKREKNETMSTPAPQEEVELDTNGKPKLSYIQMARMGYQELVNAIIRPPRADYKVGHIITTGRTVHGYVTHSLLLEISLTQAYF